jgi:hypothetical protein
VEHLDKLHLSGVREDARKGELTGTMVR